MISRSYPVVVVAVVDYCYRQDMHRANGCTLATLSVQGKGRHARKRSLSAAIAVPADFAGFFRSGALGVLELWIGHNSASWALTNSIVRSLAF